MATTTTTAVFQNMQDAEKENPPNISKKRKSKHPLHVIISKVVCGGGVLATLNSTANADIYKSTNTNGVLGGIENNKLAVHEVGNVDMIKEDGKKSSIHDGKKFSIYEDYMDNHNKYEDEKYNLNTTPMSVSEMLMPMSVDRSIPTENIFNNSISRIEIAEFSEQNRLSLTSNDHRRQRFFKVVEYQRDILEYFRISEKKHRPKPHYMRHQTHINCTMRTILVDWLVEVAEEYNLDTETLYLSVSYVDRFLSHMSVVSNKLQLVGTAAMCIASKYEEIYPPDVDAFVSITDNTYSRTEVLRMEIIILKILSFDLCTPTSYVFINTYLVQTDNAKKVKFLSLYISELSLLEADPYLRFHPSMISAASLALARHLCNLPVWSPELEEITTYRLEDLREVFLSLSKSHSAAVNLPQQAIQEKYKAEKYSSVSTIGTIHIDDEQFIEIVNQYNEFRLK
ncbi:G2/mitotic-specific cyclin-A-like [Haematobia irritans]|uniref:G2/mitotic-specific cyclin-A-like n=1 Tax=Haematobia irritans TaxID=7368 RepID=UPI003F506B7B